ncbi:uncharacterized protein KY384_006353 [Bacidia gigantensis]|uniref:uncharacterized protein n=1 Tax=Bacidia gigantensis TaxID=2732470 RepID=UPI001D059904|nr:uncharacterized protein KY384_006353 [Bacidia gigantensis]KAG8528666.1 hypothetical protein KY384_006353 [Bacidia gigantensis]
MENAVHRVEPKGARESRTAHQKPRSPRKETTDWVNSQPPPPAISRLSSPQAISHLPHHTSLAPRGTLQVRNSSNVSSQHTKPEDKRVSEISNEATKGANRDSQISTSSTNTSGKPRTKKSVGPWRLGATIGKGATGRVRKARHQLSGQDAAVKIISKKSAEMLKSASIMAMDTVTSRTQNTHGRKLIPFGIERECVIMKLIDHPNIIKLYDMWENRGELDLKPENILMDGDGNIKIVDFGMAALQPQHEWLQTSCGSPHYACPEVISQQPYRGDLADIWSAGVVLYAMLTGSLPFCSDLADGEQNFTEVISKVLDCDYDFPEGLLSEQAEDLIIRILQPDPGERMRIRDMWRHPLVKKYEGLDPMASNGKPYIGTAPHLSLLECGSTMRYRSQIDNEILRNMRNLWHSVPETELAQRLLSKEPNHERVLYAKLQQFQDRLLENYQSTEVDYSTSDYHHVTQPPKRYSSTMPTLGENPQHASRFSLLQPGTYHSRRTSIARTEGTEESYDPFRPSRTRIAKTASADYARITVLRNASQASSRVPSSRKSSMRNPVLDKLQEEDSASVGSLPSAGGTSGHDYFQRMASNQRRISHGHSRVSIMSKGSATTGSTVTVFRKSISSTRRNVTFPHQQRRQLSGPGQRRLRSAGSQRSPFSLHQQYLQGETTDAKAAKAPIVDEETGQIGIHTSPRRGPRKHAKVRYPGRIRMSSQSSISDARKVSYELAQLIDETWNRDSMTSAVTESTPVTGLRGSQQSSYASPATSISISGLARTSLQPSGLRTSVNLPPKEYKDRSLPPSPPEKSVENDILTPNTRLDIARTREVLRRRARDSSIPPGYLDAVIEHLDRLMQPSTVRLAEEQRRAVSTPEAEDGIPRKDTFEKLIGTHIGYRTRSEPTQKHQDCKRKSTIRIVDDGTDYKGLSPIKPLAIRKKSNASTRSSSSGSKSPSLRNIASDEQRYLGSRVLESQNLDAIDEEDKENFDPVTRNSYPGNTSKKRHWFRRHQYQPSRDTDFAPPLVPKDERPLSDPSQLPGNSQILGLSKEETKPRKLNPKKSLLKLFTQKNKSKAYLALTKPTDFGIKDSDGQESDTSSTDRPSSRDPQRRNISSSTVVQHKKPKPDVSKSSLTSPREIIPQPQNWLARLLGIKPATRVLCFQISRMRARREISTLFHSWKKYGLRNIVIDKPASRIWARVDAENSLNIPPMRLACEVHTVLFRGGKANLSIARLVQEKGAKSSFLRVLDALEEVLRGKGVLVEDVGLVEEVRRGVGF